MARGRDTHRALDIAVTYSAALRDGTKVEGAQVYRMSVQPASKS